MARTKMVYTQPTRDPTAKPPRISRELYADILNPICFAYPLVGDDETLILIPGGRNHYDGDVSEDADWLFESDAELVWKNVLVYEKMGTVLGKRIVRYKGKDAATAFPLLERPVGGPLNSFLYDHRKYMYTAQCSSDIESETGKDYSLTSAYLPLIYRWALQTLSALSAIHIHGIIHMSVLSPDSFWLREDLSFALVGFQSADFMTAKCERVQGNEHCGNEFRLPHPEKQRHHRHQRPTLKNDHFDWATLIYELMTNMTPWDNRDHSSNTPDEMIRTGNFPVLEEAKLGRFLRECCIGNYASAADLMRDIAAYLTEQGFNIENDDIRDFDHLQFQVS